MSYPGAPIIRVGYRAPRLPYPVGVHLPPISGQETRTDPRVVGPQLDIIVPQDSTRHEKLGRFINAWGALESTLSMILTHLTPLGVSEAHIMFPKFGMKNALDLLDGLGRRKLAPDSAKALTTLLERASKLNTKRNILVHGQWVLEANVVVKRGEAAILTQFLRETTPTDPDDAKAMGDPRNQKQRVRYAFTLKRIEAVTRDTDQLNIEIGRFAGAMKALIIPADEIGHRLALSRPYRVTYST